MTREEMIEVLTKTPNQKVAHWLFSKDEYLYKKENDNRIWDENDYLFEDWESTGLGRHDGVRSRIGGNWETGWKIVD